MESLPKNRKIDRWHEAMMKENIWHQWFFNGIVESETMLSRSALAHIYDNVKAKTRTSPTIRFAKRGLSVLLRARNTSIRFKPWIEFFYPFCSCAVGVRGDDSEAPEKYSHRLQRHRQPPQSPRSRYQPKELHRMMPRGPLLSLRISNGIRRRCEQRTNRIPVQGRATAGSRSRLPTRPI